MRFFSYFEGRISGSVFHMNYEFQLVKMGREHVLQDLVNV